LENFNLIYMKKYIKYYFLFVIMAIYSCKSDKNVSEKDAILVTESGIEKVFNELKTSEYIVDSTFFNSLNLEKYKSLKTKEVKLLSEKYLNFEGNLNDFVINDFFFIDSLKDNNAYDGYAENIDIGMVKISQAFALHKFILLDKLILTWGIYYSTYEACPYGAGTYIFLSVFKDGKLQKTYNIGEDSGGGDAPYWSETKMYSVLDNTGKISVKTVSQTGGDTDEKGNELPAEVREEKIEVKIN